MQCFVFKDFSFILPFPSLTSAQPKDPWSEVHAGGSFITRLLSGGPSNISIPSELGIALPRPTLNVPDQNLCLTRSSQCSSLRSTAILAGHGDPQTTQRGGTWVSKSGKKQYQVVVANRSYRVFPPKSCQTFLTANCDPQNTVLFQKEERGCLTTAKPHNITSPVSDCNRSARSFWQKVLCKNKFPVQPHSGLKSHFKMAELLSSLYLSPSYISDFGFLLG